MNLKCVTLNCKTLQYIQCKKLNYNGSSYQFGVDKYRYLIDLKFPTSNVIRIILQAKPSLVNWLLIEIETN